MCAGRSRTWSRRFSSAYSATTVGSLRDWEPARGLSLLNFVGLIAERQVISIVRRDRLIPFVQGPSLDKDPEVLPASDQRDPEDRVESRFLLDAIILSLSARELVLFQRLILSGESVQDICRSGDWTPSAVYTWRSRFAKRARELAGKIRAEEAGGTHRRRDVKVGGGL